MKRYGVAVVLLGLGAIVPVSVSRADELSIYDVQFTTDPSGYSPYDGQTHDVVEGIVTGLWLEGGAPRVYLQAEGHSTWGGVVVKDLTDADALATAVVIGDQVDLSEVYIEEGSRGNTTLLYDQDSAHSVNSSANPVPQPIIVPVSEIPAPVEDPPGEWYVVDHDAERYEGMRLIVRDVTVTERNLGKANDNYVLETPDQEKCWAADYMNEDVGEGDLYHDFVTPDQHFCAVVGVFEQYTNLSTCWDYYQLVTMSAADLALCGDGDSDGDMDIDDFPRFHECFTGPVCDNTPGGCNPPEWGPPVESPVQHCLMMDMDYDGDVDLRDFAGLQVVFGTDYVQ